MYVRAAYWEGRVGVLRKGKVHIYTGPGKGKTTAALGLAVRAAGAGLKVCIYQFIKGKGCGELKILNKIKNIRIEQCGRGCFIKGKPRATDMECAHLGLARARLDIMMGRYDLAILDEANVAIKLGLIDIADMLDIIKNRPAHVELVLTGRDADKRLVAVADYVTCCAKVKHPFDKGLSARCGIEY